MKTRFIAILAVVFLAACSEPEATNVGTAERATPTPTVAAPAAESPQSTTQAVAQSARDAEEPAARIDLAQADESSADLAAAGFREGEHYVRISPAQPTASTGAEQVEVAEFFMYSCIHCYNFEPYVEQWLQSKADYVNFVRVPTTWNPVVRLHAQAFYAAAALDKGAEMHTPFFREMHVNNNYLQSKDAIEDFFGRFDVGSEAFENAFESFSVNTSLRRADELARRYRVDSTPTIVINGKYRTNASMAGGYPQLLELIDALAAAEYAAM